MIADRELETWQSQWQRQPVSGIPADLRRRVERESRRMRRSLFVPVLTTLIVGGFFTIPAIGSSNADAVGLAGSVWIIFGLTWAFVLWNSAGTWRPEAETTAAFLDISVRRCQRALRATAFGGLLYVCELAFCLNWILRHQSGSHHETFVSLIMNRPVGFVVWVVTPAFFSFVVWYSRRKQRELHALAALGRQWNSG